MYFTYHISYSLCTTWRRRHYFYFISENTMTMRGQESEKIGMWTWVFQLLKYALVTTVGQSFKRDSQVGMGMGCTNVEGRPVPDGSSFLIVTPHVQFQTLVIRAWTEQISDKKCPLQLCIKWKTNANDPVFHQQGIKTMKDGACPYRLCPI